MNDTTLKGRVSKHTVELLADHPTAFAPSFPRRRFVRAALKGLTELELKARIMIDHAVHHLKVNGTLSPKIFKWATRQVKRGERLVLDKRHRIRPISTRRYYPGAHRCEVLLNGESLAIEDFELFAVE